MQPKYLNKNQSNKISQNLNHIKYPYPDLRKNEKKKKKKLTGGSSLYVRISILACTFRLLVPFRMV